MIDMRSDTLTKPSIEMRNFMHQAEVGDDCYGEDVSVNKLEEYCKMLFEVEDAIFVPSGTMANQIAIKSQVDEGNEILTEANYHVNFYESASTAILSRAVVNYIRKENGVINKDDVDELIKSKPRGPQYSKPQLVSIENTINYYQGKIFPMKTIKELFKYTRSLDISLHMDGARLFNAHVSTGIPLHKYARYVDTLSICFAKGLGAPYGSMLMGKKETIKKARAIRKQFGGGLHQVGIYASAAQYSLENNIQKIEKDHLLAKELAKMLETLPYVQVAEKVETNMIFFNIREVIDDTQEFINLCEERGLLIFPWLPGIVRIVISNHITKEDVYKAVEVLSEVIKVCKRGIVHVY